MNNKDKVKVAIAACLLVIFMVGMNVFERTRSYHKLANSKDFKYEEYTGNNNEQNNKNIINYASNSVSNNAENQNKVYNTINNTTTNNKNNIDIFINEPTEGKQPITESEATEILKYYLKNSLYDSEVYPYEIKTVTVENVKPTNYFEVVAARDIITADFERQAYVFYCTRMDELETVTVYVDLYTGNVIGGYYGGV